jgi:hypothetical protein
VGHGCLAPEAGGCRDDSQEALVALDVATGRERWRFAPVLRGSFRMLGPWMLVETLGGTLAALDRSTGSLVWSRSFGQRFELLLEPQAAPRWLLVASVDRELAAFDLAGPASVEQTGPTTIEGRVVHGPLGWASPPRNVRVGDRLAGVARDGTFRAVVTGQGDVAVAAVLQGVRPMPERRDGCPASDAVRVPLDGSAHRVTLTVTFQGCE